MPLALLAGRGSARRRCVPRALAGATGVGVLLVALTGCKYAAALEKREFVVLFKPSATQAQHRLLLADCGNVPNALPEPMGNGTLPSELHSNVRFRIDKASDAQVNQLAECIGKPQYASFVAGYDIPDTSH